MKTLVVKFGGSSLADVDCIRRCADVVRRAESDHRVVTVVSAMGGVTDALLDLAEAAGAGNRSAKYKILGELRQRHEDASQSLGAETEVSTLLDQLDTIVTGIAAVGELTPRSRDAVVSFGERLCARLTAAALDGRALDGFDAGIVTDDCFGEAEPLMSLSLYQVKERIQPLLEQGARIVVTGFIAATQHGVISTIGRGGSDYTATILGAALDADEIWICSDVDGLMTADPRIVPSAKLLDTISFAESIEMGQFGAKSMHPRALEPAAEQEIPVRIRSTVNWDCQGTLIGNTASSSDSIRAALLLKNCALITIAGANMVGRPGTAARAFQALADAGINIQMISQTVSEAGISVVVAGTQLARARASLERELLRTKIARHIEVDEDVAVVAVVGAAMKGTHGIAARVFGAVAESGINVEAIAQGSSELSICFVVSRESGPAAVRALHNAFDLGG
jgi:aspartate kinase